MVSQGKKLVGMMRGVNPLKIFLLDKRAVEISPGLEGWMRYWWGYNLKKMRPIDWFEVHRYDLLWETEPAAAETVIELLLESHLQHPYRFHLIVISCLMTLFWRKNMGKEADLLLMCLWTPTFGIWSNMNLRSLHCYSLLSISVNGEGHGQLREASGHQGRQGICVHS